MKTAILGGTDFGVKTVISGGLKVASEKGYLDFLLKNKLSFVTCFNIAFMTVENIKSLLKMVTNN